MKGKIMVVDDSMSLRKSIKFVLEKDGYEVVEAENGKVAISKLDPSLKLIISDINMPEMDGIEFVKIVRQSATNRTTPVIVLTTESQDDLKQAGKAAGATGWIVKPFEPQSLLGVVSKLIG